VGNSTAVNTTYPVFAAGHGDGSHTGALNYRALR